MIVRLFVSVRIAVLSLCLSVPAGAQPCPAITLSIDFDAQGVPFVRANGQTGPTYELEASEDTKAASWGLLQSFSGELIYADPSTASLPARFYRAVCQTGGTLSENVVGWIAVRLQSGQRALLTNCFAAPGGGALTVSQLISGAQDGQLPAGTTVHVWNGASFESAVRASSGWLNDPIVPRGRGFWLEVGTVTGAEGHIFLAGEVPEVATTTITGILEDVVGNPYPVATDWALTSVAQNAPPGSQIHVWDGAGFVTASKGRFGWSPSLTLSIGQGAFVDLSAELTWEVTKPYAWP